MRKTGPNDALAELKDYVSGIEAEEIRLRRAAHDDLLRADVLRDQLSYLRVIVNTGDNAHGGDED